MHELCVSCAWQYANYLAALSERAKLNVLTSTEVKAVRRCSDVDGFEVEVISAGGGSSEVPRSCSICSPPRPFTGRL